MYFIIITLMPPSDNINNEDPEWIDKSLKESFEDANLTPLTISMDITPAQPCASEEQVHQGMIMLGMTNWSPILINYWEDEYGEANVIPQFFNGGFIC